MDHKKNNDGIKMDDIITIDYSARLKDGRTVMSTADAGPLTFKVGDFPLIKGFNEAVIGMRMGESKKIEILPIDAFGDIDEKLIREVSLEELPEFIRVGQRVTSKSSKVYFNVLDVNSDEDIAIIDANHILAGQTLEFSIKILSIKLPPNSAKFEKKTQRIRRELGRQLIGIPAFI